LEARETIIKRLSSDVRDANFCVALVAQLEAIEPLYKEQSMSLVTLDAGYMCELLINQAFQYSYCLELGELMDDQLSRDLFDLQSGHQSLVLLTGKAERI